MAIYKLTYSYQDEAFMLVESDTPDDAAERLSKQLSSSGVKFEIKSIVLLQEVPTGIDKGLMN